jgi:hypothetical protein
MSISRAPAGNALSGIAGHGRFGFQNTTEPEEQDMSSSVLFAVGLLLSGQGFPQPWEFNPPLPPGARVIGPARVVQPSHAPAPATQNVAPAPQPDSFAVPPGGSPIPDQCEGCTGTPDTPPHNCTPVVAPKPHPDPSCMTKECKPIKIVMNGGDLPRINGNNYPACVEKRPATGTVKVPTEICDTHQTIEIGHRTFESKCCKFTVCVPVQECCVEKVRCGLHPRHSRLELCIKPDGRIDVYVLDVPGMPRGWVSLHNATKEQVMREIPDLSPPLR